MKRYLKDFNLSISFVKDSILDCLDGRTSGNSRWKRSDTASFLTDYAEKYLYKSHRICFSRRNLQLKIKSLACEEKERLSELIDFISEEIYFEIKERRVELSAIYYEDRYDDVCKKTRRIGISTMKQQCLDYIAVNACKKMFLAKISHYQCASLKDKGQLFGKQAIETWIRTNPKKCKWIFKADVKQFYPSVNHEIIKSFLDRDIKNKDIKYLIYRLIDTYEQGLCIGSYLCQYLANYYLSYAYHYITEMLFVERRRKRQNLVHHALFYMDDIILFGSNKKHLKMAINEFETYLKNKLDLKLKPTYQLFPLNSRPIDMMGYKIYTYKTTVRKRIFSRANKVFIRCKGKNEISLEDSYKIVSYYGYFKHTYSKKYIKKVKLNKSIDLAKEVISNESKSNVQREAT